MNRKAAFIGEWLADLAISCVPRKTVDLAAAIARYAEDLSDLSHEAFTPFSREQAARKWKYFPAYSELRKFLEDFKPKAQAFAALPPVDDPSLSPEDLAHVRSWINLRNEGNLKLRLRMYREKWPRAFDYIVRVDAEAEAIAKRNRWISAEPIDVSEAGIARNLVQLEGVANEGATGIALASLGLSILRKNVQQHAPDRLQLLPDVIMPRVDGDRHRRSVNEQMAILRKDYDDKFTALHGGRKPGQLTREQLAQLRAGNPALQAAQEHSDRMGRDD